MEGGDIGEFSVLGQACLFENLLASPPVTLSGRMKHKLYVSSGDWDSAIKLWKPNDIPVKSLIDSVNRRGISTLVVTFLSPDAVDPIYNWLLRKGVTTSVLFYESAEVFADDLRFNRSLLNVFVPDKETAYALGFRATIATTTTLWNI